MRFVISAVPAIVVCDNCKQAVTANKDWIEPELNKDYAEWAEHNGTVILPAKIRKPKFYRRKNVIGNFSLNKRYNRIFRLSCCF